MVGMKQLLLILLVGMLLAGCGGEGEATKDEATKDELFAQMQAVRRLGCFSFPCI